MQRNGQAGGNHWEAERREINLDDVNKLWVIGYAMLIGARDQGRGMSEQADQMIKELESLKSYITRQGPRFWEEEHRIRAIHKELSVGPGS